METPGEIALRSEWTVEATVEEVADILRDVERLPDWWGAVYLSVEIVDPGVEEGIGRVVAFHSRGWLPYTLRWHGRVVQANRPHGWTIEATGDLVGRGVWTLAQHGAVAHITYDWRVLVEKPLLRLLALVLRPIYAANHRWAMARGQEGLRAEVARRRIGGPGADLAAESGLPPCQRLSSPRAGNQAE
jgi:hypothetical protein